jgi:Dynamin family
LKIEKRNKRATLVFSLASFQKPSRVSLSYRTKMSSPSVPPAPSSSSLPTPQPSIGRSIIPALTKLREILSQLGEENLIIDLPQVVAIGSEGSGKSSVVESLVGRDFLPRGVKTRRPIVIQLVRNVGDEEWGEFDHISGKRFYDFEEIKREIQVRLSWLREIVIILDPLWWFVPPCILHFFSAVPNMQSRPLKVKMRTH